MKTKLAILMLATGALLAGAIAQGPGHRGQHGGGPDMAVIRTLFAARHTITRKVEQRPDGIVTITESTEPDVAKALLTHVQAMKRRLEERRPIHARDPFFATLFKNAHLIEMKVEPTKNGVKVTETSKDAYAVKLVKQHGGVVNAFIENGMREMRRDHEPPAK